MNDMGINNGSGYLSNSDNRDSGGRRRTQAVHCHTHFLVVHRQTRRDVWVQRPLQIRQILASIDLLRVRVDMTEVNALWCRSVDGGDG